MAHPLDGCRAKVERAEEHLHDLSARVNAYMLKNLRGATVKRDDASAEQTIDVLVAEPPPLVLGVITGEIANHLRTALDYVVYELIRKNGQSMHGHVGFPLAKAKAEYETNGVGSIRGVSAEAAALVESQQPYHGTPTYESHPLWQLKSLVNTDRHNVLVVSVVKSKFVDVTFSEIGTGKSLPGGSVKIASSGKEETAHVIPPQGSDVNMHTKFAVQVVLDGTALAGGELIPTLFQLLNRVKGTLNLFVPLLR